MHKEIDSFNPEIEELNESHKELIKYFSVGNSRVSDKSFNCYIKDEAFEDQQNGDGVSYIVYDVRAQDEKEVVAYFTLMASSIPYISRLREDNGSYNEEQCGISAIEIRMFAVNEIYQDTFYQGELIAAMVFKNIISMIDDMSKNTLGVKAIYLHSVAEAESFYEKCNMNKMEKYMQPFHNADSELQGMYAFIRKVPICYEE